jgi:hypothetical protein
MVSRITIIYNYIEPLLVTIRFKGKLLHFFNTFSNLITTLKWQIIAMALENGCVLVGGTVQDYVHSIKKKKARKLFKGGSTLLYYSLPQEHQVFKFGQKQYHQQCTRAFTIST